MLMIAGGGVMIGVAEFMDMEMREAASPDNKREAQTIFIMASTMTLQLHSSINNCIHIRTLTWIGSGCRRWETACGSTLFPH